MRTSFFVLAGVLIALPLQAQTALPPTNQEIFAPLDLPAANAMRTGGGAPGAEYWQNRADYRITASLDTVAHRVTGSETIHYTNNSPDSLRFLWLQLDQNLFKPGSMGALVNSGNRWRGAFADGGDRIDHVQVTLAGRTSSASPMVADTRMRVDLPSPLPPHGGTVDLDIGWSFVIPEYGADRTGRYHGQDGWVYEVAQWYPRMYVYDDVHGWNPMPYQGQGEFYLEYGSFDVAITVPHDVIVVATGELENPDEVLTTEQRRRLDRARGTAETVAVVSPDEVRSDAIRPPGDGPLTWRFHADNVRDVSWGASRAFIWDATSWEDVLIMSAYPREGLGTPKEPGWEMAAQYARHTISYYSTQWYRYPYPVAINVAGVVGGMEYPMIVFCSVDSRDAGLFSVTDHELGHSWFPMIVGSDERRWAWMDEGFNTFINHYSNLDYYGDAALSSLRTQAPYIVAQQRSPLADQPIMTYPDELRRNGLGFLAYRKPGYGLVMLREDILGRDRFDAAFREYIRRWAFKHPKPQDFFRTMEDVSGADLDWFWRGWFFGTGTLDQAVDGVTTDASGSHVALSNRNELVMPVILELTYDDGTRDVRHLPVEIWATGDHYTLDVPDHTVVGARLDPDDLYPDVVSNNDAWPVVSMGGS